MIPLWVAKWSVIIRECKRGWIGSGATLQRNTWCSWIDPVDRSSIGSMVAKTTPFRHNPTMLLRKGTEMTNKDLSKALVAAIQNRQLARGETMQDTNSYTVGYLEAIIGNLVGMSPKVKKEIMTTLVYITNNKE